MKTILFVCTANIIRSPMAEYIFKKILAEQNIQQTLEISSLGTWTVDGQTADKNAIEVMKEWNIDLSKHRSRMLQENHLQHNPLILVMEQKHKEALSYEFPKQSSRILLLSELIGKIFEIGDPYKKSIKEFRKVAVQINDLLTAGCDHILHLS